MATERNSTPRYGKATYVDGGIIRKRGRKYVAEVNDDGARSRKTFETKPEAKKWIENKRSEIRTQGTKVLRLQERQVTDALDALKILKGSSTLTAAATFWMKHHEPKGGAQTVDQLFDSYIDSKKKAGRRLRTLDDIRIRVGRFVKDFSGQGVHEITPFDCESWIDSLGVHGVSRANYIRAVRSFFKFALTRNLIQYNPAQSLEKPSIDEKLPEFLPVEQVENILQTAEKVNAEIAIALAIQFFAGLRTAEVQGLDWKDIDFNERIIRVRPAVAKRHRSRNVDISDNLFKWLFRYRNPKGLVSPVDVTFRRRRSKVLQLAGVDEWPSNAARHTYATYHLAMYEDAGKTSLQLGHKDVGVLYNHYRGLARHNDAQKYWEIVPRSYAQQQAGESATASGGMSA